MVESEEIAPKESSTQSKKAIVLEDADDDEDEDFENDSYVAEVNKAATETEAVNHQIEQRQDVQVVADEIVEPVTAEVAEFSGALPTDDYYTEVPDEEWERVVQDGAL